MLTKQNMLLIALSCLPKVGRRTIRKIFPSGINCELDQQLLSTFLSSNNLSLIYAYLRGKGKLFDKVERIKHVMEAHAISICNSEEEQFPSRLKHIPDCPIFLFYKGTIDVASLPQIAIVGSRNASSEGLSNAYSFSKQVSSNHLVVCSGLALGVDSAAHKGAIDSFCPTVAVMGTGLDAVYPKSNSKLAKDILANGCWLSEYLPGSKPLSTNFPRRNRIISGLSLGVLVVEARLNSGTLITARTALEQNREVFAIPGSINFKGSEGSNGLIKQGAKLVSRVEDILDEFNLVSIQHFENSITKHHTEHVELLTNTSKMVFNFIDFNSKPVEEISYACKLPVDVVNGSIAELELLNLIKFQNGGFVRIT